MFIWISGLSIKSNRGQLCTGFIHLRQAKIQGLFKDFPGPKRYFSRTYWMSWFNICIVCHRFWALQIMFYGNSYEQESIIIYCPVISFQLVHHCVTRFFFLPDTRTFLLLNSSRSWGMVHDWYSFARNKSEAADAMVSANKARTYGSLSR